MALVNKDDLKQEGAIYLPGERVAAVTCSTPQQSTAGTVFLLREEDGRKHRLEVTTGATDAYYDSQPGTAATFSVARRDPGAVDRYVRLWDEEGWGAGWSGPTVLLLTDPLCGNPAGCGGKAASLAKLSQLEGVRVPTGLCLTTAAWAECISPQLEARLAALCSVTSEGDIAAACSAVQSEVGGLQLPAALLQNMEEAGARVWPGGLYSTSLAVRSSAVGEDGREESCAGLHDTVLGVHGRPALLAAIKQCWASVFSIRAVEYRRQHGVALAPPPALVLQLLLPARAAGVAFSCDPVTGEPGLVTITANWGLGESVVGGTAEPDTLQLRQDEKREWRVVAQKLGTKQTRLQLDQSGQLTERSTGSAETECCLSDTQAINIATTVARLESLERCAVDVEVESRLSIP